MPVSSIHGWTPREVRGNPKVSMVIAAYRRPDPLACLLWCLKSQTWDNWEAIVMHDGEGPQDRQVVEGIGDPRIRFVETAVRQGNWGHPLRGTAVQLAAGDFIGMTNDDNYYAPVYFEWMLHELTVGGADFVHCNMVHSHAEWAAFPTAPRKHQIDMGGWLARADLVKTTPFWDMSFTGDGTFVEELAAKARKVVHVPGFLFIHN